MDAGRRNGGRGRCDEQNRRQEIVRGIWRQTPLSVMLKPK
jgi:hypothetical protein